MRSSWYYHILSWWYHHHTLILGQALVPYYRQLLPVFNLFKQKNCKALILLLILIITTIVIIIIVVVFDKQTVLSLSFHYQQSDGQQSSRLSIHTLVNSYHDYQYTCKFFSPIQCLVNSGDGIDYHQRFSENIGDLIEVNNFYWKHWRPCWTLANLGVFITYSYWILVNIGKHW